MEIDRSFAVQPPRCITALGRFQYGEDVRWIELAEQSARELVWRASCLTEVQDWIASEEAARSILIAQDKGS